MAVRELCVPPIRWLQRFALPPQGTADWQRIDFQPMLYAFLWIAAIVIMVVGDFNAYPQILADTTDGAFWLWGGLSLGCPPLALFSVRMVQSLDGRTKYRGLWIRMAADIGQLTALTIYMVLRLSVGDYHVYPIAALSACWVFIAHLVMRDAKRIIAVESLAKKLHQNALDTTEETDG